MPAAMCFVYWRRIWWYWNSDHILSFEGEKMKKKNSTHIFFVSVLLHSFLFIKFCFPLFEYIFTIQKHGERKYDGWIKMSHRIHQLIHSEKLKASLPLMSANRQPLRGYHTCHFCSSRMRESDWLMSKCFLHFNRPLRMRVWQSVVKVWENLLDFPTMPPNESY